MKQRCGNKNNRWYKDYGGRGIKIYPEWTDNYLTFRDWALSNGYADNLTIDRIDNNGNYEPSNCRWADKETQSSNQRRNIYLTYNNETKTVTQWAKEFGVSISTFRRWIKQGKSLDEIEAETGGVKQ
jgi:TnpA family transposase